MTAPTLRLNRLHINGFRGIRAGETPVEVPFEGRLTVLLAANGTGKTSICQAAEWALTGAVKNFDPRELAWKGDQTRSIAPTVDADVLLDGAPWRLKSRPDLWTAADETRRLTSKTEILRLLAPDAIPQEVGPKAISHRQDWLRGTRFLDGADFRLLLDSDKDTLGARKRVLADLFGIQHLNQADSRLEQYIGTIGRRLGQEKTTEDKLKAELHNRKQDALLDPSLSAQADVLDAEVKTLFELLDMPPQADDSLDQRLEQAAARLKHIALEHEAQGENVARISALTSPLDSLNRDLDALVAQERRLDWTLRRTSHWLERVTRAWETAAQSGVQPRSALSLLTQRWEECQRLFPELLNSADLGADQAAAAYLDVPSTDAEIQQHHRALDHFKDGLGLYWQSWNRLQTINADLAHEKKPATTEDVKEATAAVEQAGTAVKVLEDRLAAMGTAESALRRAADAFVESCEPPAKHCPACGQDWDTPEGLQAAFRRTMDGMPAALRRLEEDLRNAEAKRREQGALLANLERRLALQTEAEDLQGHLDTVEQEAARIGLGTSAHGWSGRLQEARRHLDSGVALRTFLSALNAAEAALGMTSDGTSSLQRRYQAVVGIWREKAERHEKRKTRTETLIQRLQAKLVTTNDQLGQITSRLSDLQGKVLPARRSWAALSKESYSHSAFLAVSTDFQAKGSRIAKAERSLKVVRDLQDAGHRHSRIAALEKDLYACQMRVEGFTTLQDRAQEARKAVGAHRDQFIQTQMKALLPYVESLFARVHANQVFDRLLNTQDDPLSWFGEFQGQPVDPKEFSQGQRQDLALAIFLARACSLKGTFFLDEPLAHLDDLNRVAAIDILRMIALTQPDVHLVVTTANRLLARHIKEKFGRLEQGLVEILALEGGPRGTLSVIPV